MARLGKSDFAKSERMIYNKDEGKWLKDWEINGTRRPFPPLYEAVKAYGERIYPTHCKIRLIALAIR